jgi:SulP family sulfate permease
VSFAALVFGGGYLADFIADGISLYLGAAALTLAILAWRSGSRGVVGGLQPAAAAVLAVVAATTAVTAFGSIERAFLTVVAATLVVTVLSGAAFLALGTLRSANLLRFVPVPVVGGFIAGTGWLLLKSGIYVSSDESPYLTPIADLFHGELLKLWLPAFVFGVILLVATRLVRTPLVIPVVLVIGVVLFAIGMVVTGSSIASARSGHWLLLGPFDSFEKWQPWTFRALGGADWSAVLAQWTGILTAVFVAVIAILFNISGTEVVLNRDLDTNEELRNAGVLNVISGALGGIPGYHALSLTALAERMNVDARVGGLIAAAVPLAAVVFGASVIELIPRMIVGGVLVFLGLAFLVEWVWDKRKILPPVEYGVVLVILAAIIGKGFLPGVVLGLVLAVVLFAVNYGRIELVREVAVRADLPLQRGPTPVRAGGAAPDERGRPDPARERVPVLRLGQRPARADPKARGGGPLRFLVIDLRRVTGGGLLGGGGLRQGDRPGPDPRVRAVLTGVSEPVRKQLARGGVDEGDLVRFEPDLDRGLQRCEEALLRDEAAEPADLDGDALAGMPAGLRTYLERVDLPEGAVLFRQDETPGDVVRRGVGAAERGDGDRRRDPDAAADRAGRCRRRRGRDVHRRPSHRGRGRRDAERGPETQHLRDRSDRGRGSRARRRPASLLAGILSERLRDNPAGVRRLLD